VSETDYSKKRGIADEPHWNEFVLTAGGELVGPHIKREGVRNADFMFPAARVIAELKILQNEFAHTKQTLAGVDALIEKYPGIDPDDRTKPLRRELLFLLRKPLQRIINSANRQIKETKRELGLDDWSGIIICVNDGFRGVPPILALGLLAHILSKASYTNTDALIYQTNHYVELPDSPYAHLLWYPTYSDRASNELVEFVNDLGRKWNRFADAKDGPYDVLEEHETLDLTDASVVTGLRRKSPYIGER
jgi:hypothetical protein